MIDRGVLFLDLEGAATADRSCLRSVHRRFVDGIDGEGGILSEGEIGLVNLRLIRIVKVRLILSLRERLVWNMLYSVVLIIEHYF